MSDATRDKQRDTQRDKAVSHDAPSVASGITITAAAARLGVSVRTVQRRLDSGTLRSIERDGRRFVLLNGDATPDATEGDTQRDTVTRHATQNDATRDTPAVALLIEQRDRDRAEITFLRGLVEQRDRDAAELRAALRESLRAMPKQLEQGKAPETAPRPVEVPATAKKPRDVVASDEEEIDFDSLIYKAFGKSE